MTPGSYADTVTITLYNIGGTVTTTLSVAATVPTACSVSALPLAFGVYMAAQLDATSTISVTCTNTTSYNVGLDNGQFGGRRMNGPASSRLPYQLFRDAARLQNWGRRSARTRWLGRASARRRV